MSPAPPASPAISASVAPPMRCCSPTRRPCGRPGEPRTEPSNQTRAPREAQRLIDTHPLTSYVDYQRLAHGLGVSESHLSRLFVEQFSITPRQYEFRRRLQRARDMLSDSRLPIKQVAYLLGFRQPSHFTGWFRKHTDARHASTAQLRHTTSSPAPPGFRQTPQITPAPPPRRAATAGGRSTEPDQPAGSAVLAAGRPSAPRPCG